MAASPRHRSRIAAAVSLLRRGRAGTRRRRQRGHPIHFRRSAGMRGDRARHPRGGRRGHSFRPDGGPAALARSTPAAHPGGPAARGNSRVVHVSGRAVRMPRDAACSRCCTAPKKASPRRDSPSICRWGRCRRMKSPSRPRGGSACWWTPPSSAESTDGKLDWRGCAKSSTGGAMPRRTRKSASDWRCASRRWRIWRASRCRPSRVWPRCPNKRCGATGLPRWATWRSPRVRDAERVHRTAGRTGAHVRHRTGVARRSPAGAGSAAAFARPMPKESRFGKVWIGSVEEARGMTFRRVFVPGVNEGLFPRPPAEDPLLLHAQRTALEIELRAEDEELLRIAVASASERLHLSFSRLDLLTGRERVPSFYAFEAHRAAGGPGDERPRVRAARALGHADAHRLARSSRCRRGDRRCRVRSRHARAARRRVRANI